MWRRTNQTATSAVPDEIAAPRATASDAKAQAHRAGFWLGQFIGPIRQVMVRGIKRRPSSDGHGCLQPSYPHFGTSRLEVADESKGPEMTPNQAEMANGAMRRRSGPTSNNETSRQQRSCALGISSLQHQKVPPHVPPDPCPVGKNITSSQGGHRYLVLSTPAYGHLQNLEPHSRKANRG